MTIEPRDLGLEEVWAPLRAAVFHAGTNGEPARDRIVAIDALNDPDLKPLWNDLQSTAR